MSDELEYVAIEGKKGESADRLHAIFKVKVPSGWLERLAARGKRAEWIAIAALVFSAAAAWFSWSVYHRIDDGNDWRRLDRFEEHPNGDPDLQWDRNKRGG